MKKSGTTMATGHAMKAASKSGVRHGPSQKNVSHGASRAAKPTSGGKTAPIKGSDRGGV